MSTAQLPARWSPIEPGAWTRRAYGRQVFLESEGGGLTTSLLAETLSAPLTLSCEIDGRMLVQLYCNGVLLLDDLVAHGPLNARVPLDNFKDKTLLRLELYLIPAGVGEVKVPQTVDTLSLLHLSPTGTTLPSETAQPDIFAPVL